MGPLNEPSSSAGHIASSAWIGLNDINTENTFLYTDSTAAVSDEALDVLFCATV